MNKYRKMSMKQLFTAYQFENGRSDKEDAQSQKSIL